MNGIVIMDKNLRRIAGACLLVGATTLAVAVTPAAATPTPATGTVAPQSAPHAGTVHGAVHGAAAQRATAGLSGSFLAAHHQLIHPGAQPRLAEQIHPAQGTAFSDAGANSGAAATHTVRTDLKPANAGSTIYTPTMYPAGGSCIEVTTIYTSSLQAVGAWDWCNNINFQATVPIDDAFVSRYTNGTGAYQVQIVQTDAASNTWQANLFDYSTNSWQQFYVSSGATQAGTVGWDINELYSDVDGNGQSYACGEMSGKTFESSGIQVRKDGAWQAADASNSDTRFDQPAEAFKCADRSFQMVNQYDHWTLTG